MPDYYFPVAGDSYSVTSGIGPRNTGIPGASRNHMGIDIAGPAGTPIVSPVSGVVLFAGRRGGFGNLVEIQDDETGYVHRFGHLQGFNVSRGDMVTGGQQFAAMGSTGVSSGPHLHYEVRDGSGRLLADVTRSIVSRGRDALGQAANELLNSNPITKAANKLLGGVFGGDAGEQIAGEQDCGLNPICYLENWLNETQFVQRAALYTLGAIFIIGAIVFLAKDFNPAQKLAKAIQ